MTLNSGYISKVISRRSQFSIQVDKNSYLGHICHSREIFVSSHRVTPQSPQMYIITSSSLKIGILHIMHKVHPIDYHLNLKTQSHDLGHRDVEILLNKQLGEIQFEK